MLLRQEGDDGRPTRCDGNPLTRGDQLGIGGGRTSVYVGGTSGRQLQKRRRPEGTVRFVESALGRLLCWARPHEDPGAPPPPLVTVTPIKARAASPAGPARRAGPVAASSGLRPARACIGASRGRRVPSTVKASLSRGLCSTTPRYSRETGDRAVKERTRAAVGQVTGRAAGSLRTRARARGAAPRP